MAEVRFDGLGPIEDGRPPLTRLGPDEPVELLEPEAGRPEIERPGLAALPVGNVVVLAEPRRVPPALPEDLGDGRRVLAHHAVVAGIAGGQLHDVPGVDRVVVPAGEQRGAGRRADRGRVELRVPQAASRPAGPASASGRVAERARRTVADVVQDDQDDVGRTCGRLDGLREVRRRVLHGQADLSLNGTGGTGSTSWARAPAWSRNAAASAAHTATQRPRRRGLTANDSMCPPSFGAQRASDLGR